MILTESIYMKILGSWRNGIRDGVWFSFNGLYTALLDILKTFVLP